MECPRCGEPGFNGVCSNCGFPITKIVNYRLTNKNKCSAL